MCLTAHHQNTIRSFAGVIFGFRAAVLTLLPGRARRSDPDEPLSVLLSHLQRANPMLGNALSDVAYHDSKWEF
jgi:hypothetical protein